MSRVRPILFNTDMVRAILDGRKTVTRRRIKPKQLIGLGCDRCPNNMPEEYIKEKKYLFKPYCDMQDDELIGDIYKPPCEPGDILYVREAWFYESHMEDRTAGEPDLSSGRYSSRYIYKADDSDYPVSVGVGGTGWQPPGTMPKEAARIWLRVANVRVEQLQDMTLDDFLSEGVCLNPEAFNDPENAYGQAKRIFMDTWNSTIKKSDQDLYGWDANPWVWVIEFERCEKPKEG